LLPRAVTRAARIHPDQWVALVANISMQSRRFFMTERFGQPLILGPGHLFQVLTEPFGHRLMEDSHEEEDGRFTFNGARRRAFGCHVDITGHGSCE
jgi:hypothetical protein